MYILYIYNKTYTYTSHSRVAFSVLLMSLLGPKIKRSPDPKIQESIPATTARRLGRLAHDARSAGTQHDGGVGSPPATWSWLGAVLGRYLFLKGCRGFNGFRGFHTVFNRVIAGYIGVARECMGRSLGAPSDPYGSTVYRISELQLSYGTNYGVIAVVTYHFVA